jgi:hypothetical protein
MPLRNDIEAQFTEAMKKKDAAAVSTLRMLRAALKNHQIDKMLKELSDEDVVEIVGKEVKKLKDSMADFEKGGRADLSDASKKEVALLSVFLPAQLSDEDVMALVKSKAEALGLAGPAAFGKLMSEVMKDAKGRSDGNAVSRAVKAHLGG